MVALIDFDSLIYQAIYKIVSIREMREAIELYGKEDARQWLFEEVYSQGINRLENQLLQMQNHLSEIFFEEIDSYELFITTCTNSFRKRLEPTYKANRKKNDYVWLVRDHYVINGASHSDHLEADDLIQIRAKEIGTGNFIIVSVDKDLKQIGGYYWSYYKVKSKDSYGNLILNDFGFHEREYKQKTVEYISDERAYFLFWQQMLVGDNSDNIKAIKGIGAKRSAGILEKSKNHFITVARIYIEKDMKDRFWVNYSLLKLGHPEKVNLETFTIK